ncbi:MAG TPA: NAD-dependent epimerase/dehydratase family protein [Candidatus Paceibacterota bacterium]|nr:NAD-dependent epimerase/dehydratase family protein [Candidatus Paceibacterota bacterium]
MAKVVVTGGGGFIGAHLVRALLDRGDDVHVVDTFIGGRYPERIDSRATYHEVDIRQTDAIEPIFAGADVVFHTAAIPRVAYSVEHPVETTDHNITGTVSVLTAAVRAKVRRVVYSSSGSAYGDQTALPLSETMVANPVNPYGLQKYVGELFAKIWSDIHKLETVSLRYFNVYGPGLDPTGPYALAVGAFLLARKEGRPLTIYGDGTITRDYTHVRDVVRANLLAAESKKVGKGEVINIGAGRNRTIKSLAEMVGGEIQYAPPRVEAHDSQADPRKAKELLGWEPTIMLDEGIAELKNEWGLS